MNHAGSRTSAARLGPTLFERGRGSSRFQKVIEGVGAVKVMGMFAPRYPVIACRRKPPKLVLTVLPFWSCAK